MEAFIILHQGNPLDSRIFKEESEARNYIKMRNTRRRFKELERNIFICKQYGSKFEIIRLNYNDIHTK